MITAVHLKRFKRVLTLVFAIGASTLAYSRLEYPTPCMRKA